MAELYQYLSSLWGQVTETQTKFIIIISKD